MQEIKTTKGTKAMAEFPTTVEGEKLPLLVFLHGIGERGTDVSWVLRYGPLKLIKDGINLGVKMNIVHPQLTTGNWNSAIVKDVVDYVKTIAQVDVDKIWLVGFSLGGLGVYECLENPEFIKELAAFVPIACAGNEPLKANIIVNEGIPGWAACAADDKVTPIGLSTRMVDAINDLAGKSQVLFSQWGLFGHSCTKFLDPLYGVYKWLSYQKLSNRQKGVIILKPGDSVVVKA